MEVFEAVRTIVAVREYQNKPVPPLTPPADRPSCPEPVLSVGRRRAVEGTALRSRRGRLSGCEAGIASGETARTISFTTRYHCANLARQDPMIALRLAPLAQGSRNGQRPRILHQQCSP